MNKAQSYIKGIIFDLIIDNLIDQEIIENGYNCEISEEKHEDILNIANELIDKIERIGFVKFARRLIKDLENLQEEDERGEVYWQEF
jgi:hypothetical protein